MSVNQGKINHVLHVGGAPERCGGAGDLGAARRESALWVWQLERRDSPLYPSATLYRQPAFLQWAPVLDTVAQDLRALAGTGSAWAETVGASR
ncbi:MAG: hypothetical protein GAK41_01070 [Burkholderia gladioli]|nr:MAG: hypothetical protein GAK41_01070 [Burkholderia gladioli]